MTGIIAFIIKLFSWLTTGLDWVYKYRAIYTVTGAFFTRKFKKAEKKHKYAVLIAARNEETVIGNLIESIKAQDYDASLINIFVVADNCTDKTAEISRNMGAVCYERFNQKKRTKGYALKYLVEQIERDYGIASFEGYFVFDADNLLALDYVSRMNDAFDAGEKIITSYRATKNFDDNWISASYAIHWLRTVLKEHRARSLFRLATRIQGTGFLMHHELLRNGWKYTSLTEDRAFCADAVVQGYKISYNNAAVFYDEQPIDIKIALRQRVRWAKGHLQAFGESGGKLFVNIFKKQSFMSFDMLTVIIPRSFIYLAKKIIVNLLRIVIIIMTGKTFGAAATVVLTAMYWSARSYFKGILTAAYVFIMERRRIKPIKWYKKLWFCLTFPIFDVIGRWATVVALFTRVEWKPIPHKANIKIGEIKI